jgi:hypothetical protein
MDAEIYTSATDNAPKAETGGTPPGTPTADTNPAARTVLTGKISEREIDLENQLTDERAKHATTQKEKKDREIKIAELEDSLRLAREIPKTAAPEKKSMMAAWLAGEDEN